jgi:flagellar basal body-associated protein FliL
MSYPPASDPQPGQPVPPVVSPQPVQKSKAGPIIAIIAAVVLVLCVGCVGGAWYFGFWFQKKTQEIVNNIPTERPTNGAVQPQNNNATHTVRYEVIFVDGVQKTTASSTNSTLVCSYTYVS